MSRLKFKPILNLCNSSGRSRGGRSEVEGEEEAATLQVGVGGFQLASEFAAAETQRSPTAPGGQALPRGHQDHRQLPRSHDQQPPEPPPAAREPRRPRRTQTGSGDHIPGPDRHAREHRSLQTTEKCPQLTISTQGQAEGQQLACLLPSGGRRGELQPGFALCEDSD